MNIGVYFDSFEKLTGIQSVIVNCVSMIQKIDKTNNYFTVKGTSSYVSLPSITSEKVLQDNGILSAIDIYNNDISLIHSYFPAFDEKIKGIKYLITINDVIPCIHPEWCKAATVSNFNGPIRHSAEMADKVFAISESTKADIVDIYSIKPEKIEVTYIGLHRNLCYEKQDTGIMEKLCLNDEFVLSVCTLEPRKNLRGLITAFIDYKNSTPGSSLKLVIAGGTGWDRGFFEWIDSQEEHKKDIIVAGYVTDDELSELYRKALTVAYVSFYEGFGLPILEGMAAGKAVISSNTSSMPEVGGDAVCYCNPYDINSIAEAIKQVVENKEYRNELSKRAKIRAQLFSYEKTARQIIDVYNSLG